MVFVCYHSVCFSFLYGEGDRQAESPSRSLGGLIVSVFVLFLFLFCFLFVCMEMEIDKLRDQVGPLVV